MNKNNNNARNSPYPQYRQQSSKTHKLLVTESSFISSFFRQSRSLLPNQPFQLENELWTITITMHRPDAMQYKQQPSNPCAITTELYFLHSSIHHRQLFRLDHTFSASTELSWAIFVYASLQRATDAILTVPLSSAPMSMLALPPSL